MSQAVESIKNPYSEIKKIQELEDRAIKLALNNATPESIELVVTDMMLKTKQLLNVTPSYFSPENIALTIKFG